MCDILDFAEALSAKHKQNRRNKHTLGDLISVFDMMMNINNNQMFGQ